MDTKLTPIAESVSAVLFKEAPDLWRPISNLLGLSASMADFAAEFDEDPAFALIRVKAILECDTILKDYPFAHYPRATVLQEALDLCAGHNTGEWNTVRDELRACLNETEVSA